MEDFKYLKVYKIDSQSKNNMKVYPNKKIDLFLKKKCKVIYKNK